MKISIDNSKSIIRRNWKRTLGAFLISFFSVSLITSPLSAEPVASTMGIGVAFAPIGGHGFSFRKLPENGLGYQCGTIFWKNDDNSYFNLGGELIYVLKHTRLTAFYIPAGIAVTYDSQLQYRYDPLHNGMGEEYRETSTHVSGGAGLGFSARTKSWEDIWFSFDFTMVVDRNDILPLPQFAIHYFFR